MIESRLEAIKNDIQTAQEEIEHLMTLVRSTDMFDECRDEINRSLTIVDSKVKRANLICMLEELEEKENRLC